MSMCLQFCFVLLFCLFVFEINQYCLSCLRELMFAVLLMLPSNQMVLVMTETHNNHLFRSS